MTSLQTQLKQRTEQDRKKDAMYCILTERSCALRKELVSGISKLVQELTTHPAVLEALQSNSIVAEKALVIGAIYAEPDFLAYSLDLPSVCSSTVSEWVVTQLPEIVQALLNGQCTLDEFVLNATHAYITL